MQAFTRPCACERARQTISLMLDGEVSQLERVLLKRHLEACPQCLAFAADVNALTRELREAPLVEAERPVTLPRRRPAAYGVRRAGGLLAAASVAATALLAVVLPAQRPQLPSVTSSVTANQDLRDLRALRRAQLRTFPMIWTRTAHGPQSES